MRRLVIGAVTVLCLVMLLSSSLLAQQRSFTFWSMWNEGEPQQQVLFATKDFEAQYGEKVDVCAGLIEVLSICASAAAGG